jgi:hypothetical protein
MSNIFIILLIIIFIIIILSYFLFTSQTENFYPKTEMDEVCLDKCVNETQYPPENLLFNTCPFFNENNYLMCTYIIRYVYNLDETSTQSLIYTSAIRRQLDEHYHADLIKTVSAYNNWYGGNTQLVMATIMKLKYENLIVIGIRGTNNKTELITDTGIRDNITLNPYENMVNINSDQIGIATYFADVNPSQVQKNVAVLFPFFQMLTTLQSSQSDKTYCFQTANCKNLTTGYYSQIDNACNRKVKTDCLPSAPSFCQDIIDTLRLYKDIPIIITGHSMGACLASLLAFNIRLAKLSNPILSVYLYACPPTGNAQYVTQFNEIVPRCYNVINQRDQIANYYALNPREGTIYTFSYFSGTGHDLNCSYRTHGFCRLKDSNQFVSCNTVFRPIIDFFEGYLQLTYNNVKSYMVYNIPALYNPHLTSAEEPMKWNFLIYEQLDSKTFVIGIQVPLQSETFSNYYFNFLFFNIRKTGVDKCTKNLFK